MDANVKQIKINLVLTGDVDGAISTNCSLINIAQGTVYIDFGFVEPKVYVELSRKLKSGESLPDSLEGRLMVRVAMSPQALLKLKEQIEEVLSSSGILPRG